MQRIVAERGVVDRFRFLGVCDRVPELLNALDLFVLPSLSEGLPMVILEAMAARKPIVATNVGAIPQVLLHERSGLVVDRSAASLASAISTLLRSADLRRGMGENAFERVRSRYSSERMAQQYAAVFDRLFPPDRKSVV